MTGKLAYWQAKADLCTRLARYHEEEGNLDLALKNRGRVSKAELNINRLKEEIEMNAVLEQTTETVSMLVLVGEELELQVFALIPEGWEDRLDEHPLDDEVYFWLERDEWELLEPGQWYGDAKVIACWCGDCVEVYETYGMVTPDGEHLFMEEVE